MTLAANTNANAHNKGFTLVELLVVLLIIGVLTSIVTISINAARPSDKQVLFNRLKYQFRASVDFAQLRNINLRMVVNQLQTDKNTATEDIEYQIKIQQKNPKNGQWSNNSELMSKIPKWKNNTLSVSEEIILISPNGFITPAVFEIQTDGDSYRFDTSKLQ